MTCYIAHNFFSPFLLRGQWQFFVSLFLPMAVFLKDSILWNYPDFYHPRATIYFCLSPLIDICAIWLWPQFVDCCSKAFMFDRSRFEYRLFNYCESWDKTPLSLNCLICKVGLICLLHIVALRGVKKGGHREPSGKKPMYDCCYFLFLFNFQFQIFFVFLSIFIMTVVGT